MDEDTAELVERRLTDKVRESVEKELKRRYWWLGVITLVLTSGTVTLIVNAIMIDARLKLETARAVQEMSSDRINKAADEVAKLMDRTAKVQADFEKRAQEAEARFNGLNDKAKALGEEVSMSSKRALAVSSDLQMQLAALGDIVRTLVVQPSASPRTGDSLALAFDSIQKQKKSSETKISEAESKSDKFLAKFRSVILGKWSIVKWFDARGNSNLGILSVDEKVSDDSFRGILVITAGSDGRKIVQEITLTRKGTKIHLVGRVVSGTNWSDDSMELELISGRLVGGGADKLGIKQENIFQKLL